MTRFIEVTDFDGNMKVLCPVDRILNIVCANDGFVFIETGVDRKGESSGILVAESYEVIKEKLKQCEV